VGGEVFVLALKLAKFWPFNAHPCKPLQLSPGSCNYSCGATLVRDLRVTYLVVLRRLVEYYRIPLDGSTIEYRKAIRIIEKIEYSKKK